ncbi:NAD(+)/NADH kinase [Natribaculum luteum]|uniref:NAD(+)/NADH kinase n=1 Tax=Natribaculum luteum TaxID=1586232 RepID=A0ABD5NXW6_9EURY|nr:NAD(+)/NADH kinase [Natribaculum luteum]
MTSAEWTPDDDPLVGIVDEEGCVVSGERADLVADLETVVADAGGDVVCGPIDRLTEREPSVLVAVGEPALLAAVRAETTVPVLPVDAGRGIRSVPSSRLAAAVRTVLDGESHRRQWPVLDVAVDGDGRYRALFDVTLVTDEPARISEFGVRSRDREVAQFRADGVVVATPAGSHGYADAAGGPLLSPAIDGVAVVPISPFVTQTRHWVLPDDDLYLSVEREEGPVALCIDDDAVATITPDSTVVIAASGSLSTLVVPDGRGYFGSPDSSA